MTKVPPSPEVFLAAMENNRKVFWEEYTASMERGRDFQAKATQMVRESEPAAEGFGEMKAEFAGRRTWRSVFGRHVQDYTYSQFSEAQKAVKDNGWYMTRATMFAGLATMEFSRASALLAHVSRLDTRIAMHKASQVG